MSKEVTYSVVARKNMLKKDDPAKYYAQAQASGDVGLDEISTRVEKACTVHSADVVAVLKALEDEMVDGLSRGEIVRLGNIGHLPGGACEQGSGEGGGVQSGEYQQGESELPSGGLCWRCDEDAQFQ